MSNPVLRMDRDATVAEVILTAGSAGNPIGPGLLGVLPRAFAELDHDPDVRAVILRGEGAHFSIGFDVLAVMEEADLEPLIFGTPEGPSSRSHERLRDAIRAAQIAANAPAACRKPVIAAIQGMCRGAGMDLATACDIRVCAKNARFSLQQVKTAIVPDLGVLQRLPALVGHGRARLLAFTGRNIDAAAAESMGLVERVYDDPTALIEGARQIAREIAQNPPFTVQGCKEVLNFALDRDVEAGMRFVATWNTAYVPSRDFQEVIRSFRERRSPKFVGD